MATQNQANAPSSTPPTGDNVKVSDPVVGSEKKEKPVEAKPEVKTQEPVNTKEATQEAVVEAAQNVADKAAQDAKKAQLAAKNAELKALVAAQKKAFADTESARRMREQASQEAARARAEADQAIKAAADSKAELEKALADPLGFMEARGITAEKLAERIVQRGTPDEKISQLEAQLKAYADRVIAAERKADEDRKSMEERERRALASQQYEVAKRNMLDTFEKGTDDKFKELNAWADKQATRRGISKPALIYDEFMTAIDRIKRDPEKSEFLMQGAYSDQEILEWLNEWHEGAYQEPKKDEQKVEGKPSLTEEPKPKVEAQAPTDKKAPPTLTNDMAGEVTSFFPDNWDKLSDREQKKLMAEYLRQHGSVKT
jgi:hypothetical protein